MNKTYPVSLIKSFSKIWCEKLRNDAPDSEGLTITEIMYHPEDDFPEFIELMNTSEEPVFLNGFSFTKGIDYTFDRDEMVYPSKGIVLTSDTSLFSMQYRFGAYGQFRKKLSNEGETIILQNKLNLTVDSVSYSRSAPWPLIPGKGYSIELIDPSLDNSSPSSWKVSDKKYGTPFRADISHEWEAMLFPNPAKDKAAISIGDQELAFAKFNIEIFNHAGLLVKSIKTESYNSEIELDTSGLSDGFYYIRVMPEIPKFKFIVIKVFKLQ